MTDTEHTHDAWKIGAHDVPDDFVGQFTVADGDVLVHDLNADRWFVLTYNDFTDRYEWIV